jgi:predicted nucleic acid-binding protein
VLLLDTSVLIDLEHELAEGTVGPVRTFLGGHRGDALACSTVTVGELASGADQESIRFFLRRLRKIPLDEAIAYRAGELDHNLTRSGMRLGENDNWIAATALHYSATLLHIDGDFRRVPRLKRHQIRT